MVCVKCARWNLSPLEERWETIEDAERVYRETRTRVATDNVGSARLRDGTDLIRIGTPLRSEYAAWRYGDTFGRRRRRQLLIGASTVVAAGVLGAGVVGGAWSMYGAAWGGALLSNAVWPVEFLIRKLNTFTVQSPDGELLRLSRADLSMTTLAVGGFDGTRPGTISVHVNKREYSPFGVRDRTGKRVMMFDRSALFDGDDALRILPVLLTAKNRFTGSSNAVTAAVEILDAARSPHTLLATMSDADRQRNRRGIIAGPPGLMMLRNFRGPFRLALEMSLHEDAERRAFDGELHVLEQRWKEAEEIAAIADGLTTRPEIASRLSAGRQERRASGEQ